MYTKSPEMARTTEALALRHAAPQSLARSDLGRRRVALCIFTDKLSGFRPSDVQDSWAQNDRALSAGIEKNPVCLFVRCQGSFFLFLNAAHRSVCRVVACPMQGLCMDSAQRRSGASSSLLADPQRPRKGTV